MPVRAWLVGLVRATSTFVFSRFVFSMVLRAFCR